MLRTWPIWRHPGRRASSLGEEAGGCDLGCTRDGALGGSAMRHLSVSLHYLSVVSSRSVSLFDIRVAIPTSDKERLHDIRQSELLQVMAFAFAHCLPVGLLVVVEAAQVQQAVNDVQRQLGLHIVAALGRLGQRYLGTDDELTRELLRVRLAERK